jgi:hypothetical protein
VYALNDDSKPRARIYARKPNSEVSNSSGLTFTCYLKTVQHENFVSLFKNEKLIDGMPWPKTSVNLMQQDDGSWVHVARGGKVCLSDHFVFRSAPEPTE